MAIDIQRQGTKGGDPQYGGQSLRGVAAHAGIVVGTVKANVHGSHMGVIQVFIGNDSTNEQDKSQWRTVRYCSPFYSRVDNSGIKDTYNDTKVPAGIVTPPPDLGTKVLCFFPHGKNAEGYYFACIPDLFMMQTLPEPTVYQDYIGGEFNDDNPQRNTNKITNWKTQFRPVDFVTQKIENEKGLDRDRVRGLNNSGYMRESPSEIIGIASKGRRITGDGKDFLKVNANAIASGNPSGDVLAGLLGPGNRRRGHSIALDDGDVNGDSNQIRLRTSTGHQILMNDTEGVIYVGNSTGTVWIELGNSGTLDVFANDSINFRTKNINFHADENIKFHSKGYTQIVSEQQMHLQSEDDFVMQSGGDAGITSKKFSVKASGMMNLSGGAASSIKAGGIMSVSGALVMLQGPSLGGQAAKPVRPNQALDPKFSDFEGGSTTNQALNPEFSDFGSQGKYVLSRDSTITSTVDRVVTHEPFVGHGTKNQPTAYSGGLAGGGGLAAAFSIISAGMQFANALPAGTVTDVTGFDSLASGVDVSDFAGANTFGSFADDAAASLSGLRVFDGTFDQATEILTNINGETFVKPFSENINAIVSATETTGGFDFGPIGDTFTKFTDTIGDKITTFTDSIGDTIGKFGNSITGTDITSFDFPGIDLTTAETDLSAFGGAGGDVGFVGNFYNSTPSIDTIASSNSFGSISSSWSGLGNFANTDLGKLVADSSGKIVDIAKQVVDEYETALPELQKGLAKINAVIPGAGDQLNAFLAVPTIKGFPVTDLVKQVDTGFSIGNLESFDVQALSSAIVKEVGSGNSYSFVDSVTKSVGKYGFNIDQLQAAGYIRPEAVFNDQMTQSSIWTGKDGVSGLSKFLQNTGIQEQVHQQDVARIYQSLVNNGGISATDGKEQIMAMITGASVSNVNVAKEVRFGNVNIEGLLRNTSNVPAGSSISDIVKNAMQTGGSAGKLVNDLNSKTSTKNEDLSTLKRFQGTLKTGETIRNINGVSYVVPKPSQNPYTGEKGGEKRSYDQRIAKLEKDRNQLIKDGNDDKNILTQVSEKLTELYAKRNSL